MRHTVAHFLINCIFVASKRNHHLNLNIMKKFTFALMLLLAFSFSLKAQQYVSTEPANRNVIIEEFTGRNCQYCPDGHRIVNELMAANPGRLWGVNIHAGGYAPTSYPNMITPDGNVIHGGFSIDGYPAGVVNRSTAAAQGRNLFASLSNQQLNQASECNIAGRVVLNPTTRIANVTVEVYYTSNSSVGENYLTVAMLQDSILGSQSGGATWNPTQMINGQYIHTHVLRDVITSSAWGDPISPTTQGTLITRNFVYEIPETIGSPNGVNVVIDNISFLAWVAERQQGSAYRPILTGCELELLMGSDEPIYPMIRDIAQDANSTCSHTKIVNVKVQNGGTETLTQMSIEAEVEGQVFTQTWEGSIAQYADEVIAIPVEVPFGDHAISVRIVEANGQQTDVVTGGSVSCLEWVDMEIEGEETSFRLDLMQDKYGAQITWEVVTADGVVLASGGPYTTLASASATQLHVENFTVPANECVTFHIHDGGQNGICCSYGHGYYLIKDSDGNVLIGDENNGQFGSDAYHLISVKGPEPQVNVNIGETQVSGINYNHADFIAPLDYEGFPDEVGFECRKVTSSEPMIVHGFLNEFRNILGFTDDLEMSTIYVVKAYAVVNGETYYGQETTFQTWMEGVNELMQSLKVYPNPAANVLNIEGEGMTQVEVYNAMGQRVMMTEVNGNAAKVNTESLSNGMYVVRIHANDGTVLNRTFSVAR